MLESISHRGPDDEGMFIDDNLMLGHRRLSIIDIGHAGHQPMHYRYLSIDFNGEIYNYIKIRQELQNLGHRFKTRSDTAVILHAYEEWGATCLERFVGMWAFAILDMKRKILFCSRDRFGIKPFYYFENEELFLFASGIKAILAAGVKVLADMDILMAYLVVGISDHSIRTFFRDIYQLQPGCYAMVDLGAGIKRIERYYDLSERVVFSEGKNGLADYLEKSVSLHLRSDVPVATCLSGGIDSSTIAAFASDLLRKKMKISLALLRHSRSCYTMTKASLRVRYPNIVS